MIQDEAIGNIPSRTQLAKDIEFLGRPQGAQKLIKPPLGKYPSAHKQARRVWLFQKCRDCGKIFRIKDSIRSEHLRSTSAMAEVTFIWSFDLDYNRDICPECYRLIYFQKTKKGELK